MTKEDLIQHLQSLPPDIQVFWQDRNFGGPLLKDDSPTQEDFAYDESCQALVIRTPFMEELP